MLLAFLSWFVSMGVGHLCCNQLLWRHWITEPALMHRLDDQLFCLSEKSFPQIRHQSRQWSQIPHMRNLHSSVVLWTKWISCGYRHDSNLTMEKNAKKLLQRFHSHSGEERMPKKLLQRFHSHSGERRMQKLVAMISITQWRRRMQKICWHDSILAVEKKTTKLLPTWFFHITHWRRRMRNCYHID